MMVTSPGPVRMNWEILHKKVDKIETFFRSLDQGEIGKGRMIYDDKEFKLEPRSTRLKGSPSWQYLSTIGCESATFDSTREGFSKLVKRVKNLYDQVAQFRPKSKKECPQVAIDFCYKMIDLQNLIQGVSSKGFEQLCTNYRELHKPQEATDLENLGQDAFSFVKKSEEHLYGVLLPLFPDLENDIQIKRYYSNSEPLLLKRERYRANLRGVKWDIEHGIRIPKDLLEDCAKDWSLRTIGPNPAALRVAAKHIGLPQKTSKIPTLNRKTFWVPHRMVERKEGLTTEDGVVGSCEARKDLCNIYSRTDPRTGHIMMSSAVVDTPLKADELSEIIKSFSKGQTEGKWIVHQLSSFSKEESSILNTRAQIPYLEKKLKDAGHEVSFFHLNTCLDACSTSSAEERSFKEINLETFIMIANLVISDTGKFVAKSKDLADFARAITDVDFWLSHVKDFGNQVRIQPTATELKQSLKVANEQLGEKLQVLCNLSPTILSLIMGNESPIEEKKGQILFQLLLSLLINQLSSPKRLSPINEMEYYFLLYRMLNLKPVFICERGLDMSSIVRVLAEAQYLIEDIFFNDCLSPKNQMDESAAQKEAYQEIYRLLKNIDHSKRELFQLTNQILSELQFSLIKDLTDETTTLDAEKAQEKLLKEHPQMTSQDHQPIPTNLRNVVLQEIEKKVSSDKASDLYRLHVYLEMVMAAFFQDQEKTLNDSGAIGFRYHHDEVSWFHRKAKNPHPLERWPLFILRNDNVPIQILESHQLGWIGSLFTDQLAITPAGLALTHRLGKLRYSETT